MDYDMPTAMNGKESKDKGKITSMNIRKLDDGSYTMCSYTDKGHSYEGSFTSEKDLMGALADDLTSPHLKKPKLGSGKRFDTLSKELGKKGASNPDALAAWIGRKKYGKKKFQSLANKGK